MSPGKVLVVDDEPDMVENCARILKRAGYQCLTATEPGRALALVESDRPDLVVTDVKMPLKEAKERWMQVLEASYLRQLLERHGGNISAAAKAAGIDRKTFHRLVTKHQLRATATRA